MTASTPLRNRLRALPALVLLPLALLPPLAAQTLAFDRTAHAFGRIPARPPVSAVFTARNTGKAPLELREVTTSCGCTSALPAKRILAPGESTRLEVRFDPHKDFGAVEKSVTVLSNDPDQPQCRLLIQAEVYPSAWLDRRILLFQGVLPGETPAETVRCVSFSGGPVGLKGLDVPEGRILRAEAVQAGKDILVKVTLHPEPGDPQNGRQTLVLRTDDPDAAAIPLQVFWNLADAVTAFPSRLAFDLARTGTRRELPLALAHARHRPFRILAYRVVDLAPTGGAPPPFRVEGLPTAAAPERTLQVVLDPGAPAGLHTARIVLVTDDPLMPEVRVEVMAKLLP
jgi:hypothetical protein